LQTAKNGPSEIDDLALGHFEGREVHRLVSIYEPILELEVEGIQRATDHALNKIGRFGVGDASVDDVARRDSEDSSPCVDERYGAILDPLVLLAISEHPMKWGAN
jgi:hypothetical protein